MVHQFGPLQRASTKQANFVCLCINVDTRRRHFARESLCKRVAIVAASDWQKILREIVYGPTANSFHEKTSILPFCNKQTNKRTPRHLEESDDDLLSYPSQTLSKRNSQTPGFLEQGKAVGVLSGESKEIIRFGQQLLTIWVMRLNERLYYLRHDYFQDVSDRIEKEPEESELLASLQKDSIPVVRGDWKVHLGAELQEGEVCLLICPQGLSLWNVGKVWYRGVWLTEYEVCFESPAHSDWREYLVKKISRQNIC